MILTTSGVSIWEPMFISLFFDLVVVVGFILVLLFFRPQNLFSKTKQTGISFFLLITGLGVLVTFYLFDLVSKVLLPFFWSEEQIAVLYGKFHGIYMGLGFPVGALLLLIGFIILFRHFSRVVKSLDNSHKTLTKELKLKKKIEESLVDAQRVGNMGNWDWNIRTGELWWSDQIYIIFGQTPGKFEATYDAFLETVHPDDREVVKKAVNAAVEGKTPYHIKHKIVLPTGEVRRVEERGEVTRTKKGKPKRMLGIVLDITERERLEAHARMTDRIEAVGQLASGIAHNFNNLLMVVHGNLELISQALRKDQKIDRDELLEMSGHALKAAKKGTGLTRSLLAFGRQEEAKPEGLKVTQNIKDMIGLLETSLGKNIKIELNFEDIQWRVRVDSAQLESSIVNLAINAKDAMPEGGKLTIDVEEVSVSRNQKLRVPPGEYVKISVADTGTGIPEEIQARILDPYFTTKPVGKGTGLGLSSVVGFTKKFNGHMVYDTELGEGTTFSIYLPRSKEGKKTKKQKTLA